MAEAKRTVTIGVAPIEEINARTVRRTSVSDGKRITFISVELLWKTLTPKRWEIVRAMAGQAPMSIREVARRVGRDVKAVHGDVKALRQTGIVRDTDGGEVVFPYDSIRVDFAVGPLTHIAQPDLGESIRRAFANGKNDRVRSAPKARAKAA